MLERRAGSLVGKGTAAAFINLDNKITTTPVGRLHLYRCGVPAVSRVCSGLGQYNYYYYYLRHLTETACRAITSELRLTARHYYCILHSYTCPVNLLALGPPFSAILRNRCFP